MNVWRLQHGGYDVGLFESEEACRHYVNTRYPPEVPWDENGKAWGKRISGMPSWWWTYYPVVVYTVEDVDSRATLTADGETNVREE